MTLRPRDSIAVLLSAVILLALTATFAIELSNTQAHNRADIRHRVHERGVLAGALIDGLFSTVSSSTAIYQRQYSGAVTPRQLNAAVAAQQGNLYAAVIDAQGNLIAGSKGFTAASLAALRGNTALSYARTKVGYGLGDLATINGARVIPFAVAFPVDNNKSYRIFLSGSNPKGFITLLNGDLTKIPGVAGERNYVIDGHGTIISATGRRAPSAGAFPGPTPADATARRFSKDTGGHFYDEVRLNGSNWRIVLDSPDGPLYASVSGFNKWLPWLIFVAFALVGLVAFGLVARVLKAVGDTAEANARLERLNDELEGSNALLEQRAAELARSNEELDQFASIASHDLQEPLRKVRTFSAEVTRMDAENLSEKGREYLGRANAAAERMQTLIEDLLKFSRVSTHSAPLADVDLGEVVDEALDDLSEVIERTGAQIHVGDLPTISAEPVQIRQLVQNLVSNALKFQSPDRTPEIWIDAVPLDGDVSITVRDNGIGFDPRYTARIFRVFERLHGRNEYPGTGIGLALCRKIAERHGGTISAVSQEGAGSTFTVLLPMSHPDGQGAPDIVAHRGARHDERSAAHV